MNAIGALKKWPATTLWPHEAANFNPWLADHLEALDDALHADWKFVEGEAQQVAGTLFVDIVARTSDSRTAVIEAQFGSSDHDHLGKLLTYLAAYDAGVAVWIAEEPRPEHVQAITKLNSGALGVDFYMVRLEVVSIVDTDVKAPLLSLLAGPSPVIKTAGKVQANLTANQQLLRGFWQQLLPAVINRVPAFAGKKSRPVRRIGAPTGRNGVRFQLAARRHDAECALTILGGKHGDSAPVLAELQVQQPAIESQFGSKLDWIGGTRSRIRTTLPGGYLDQDQWAALHVKMADTMARLVKAVSPALASLKTRTPTQGAPAEEEDEEGEEEG